MFFNYKSLLSILLAILSLSVWANEVTLEFTPKSAKLITAQYETDIEICYSGPNVICIYTPEESNKVNNKAFFEFKNPSFKLSIIDIGNDPAGVIDWGEDPAGIVDTGNCPDITTSLSCKYQSTTQVSINTLDKLKCPAIFPKGRCL